MVGNYRSGKPHCHINSRAVGYNTQLEVLAGELENKRLLCFKRRYRLAKGLAKVSERGQEACQWNYDDAFLKNSRYIVQKDGLPL
jgi:hypothetical protein